MAKDFLKLTATNPFGSGPRRRRSGAGSRRLDETPQQRAAAWAAHLFHRDWARVGLALAAVMALTALLSLRLIPDRVSLRVGEVSGQDVRAQRSVRYLDEDTTALLRNTAVARTEPVYSSAHTSSEADEAISEAFLRLRRDPGAEH